jgi:hypothetical protein
VPVPDGTLLGVGVLHEGVQRVKDPIEARMAVVEVYSVEPADLLMSQTACLLN